MAVPSRVYFSVVVFGLMAFLLLLPYTALVWFGYSPPPGTPAEVLFPKDSYPLAYKLLLLLASVFAGTLVATSWTRLVQAARRDARRRKQLEAGKADPAPAAGPTPPASPPKPEPGARRHDSPPPGYQ